MIETDQVLVLYNAFKNILILKNHHYQYKVCNVVISNVAKGGFPFSGKYRAIDFFRSLSFELQ